MNITLVKPISGADCNLHNNLRSFFRQRTEGFSYDIIFCFRDKNDTALSVVGDLTRMFPDVRARVIFSGDNDALNPKVNNMIPAFREATGDVIVISDANVEVSENYISDIRHEFVRDGSVGLLTHMFKGVGAKSFWAGQENARLNYFILPSVWLLNRVARVPTVVGKSMAIRRDIIAAIGGLEAFKDYLAEDFMMGEAVARTGARVVLSREIIRNVNANTTARRFFERHVRWNRMRLMISPFAYLVEIVSNPLVGTVAAGLAAGWQMAIVGYIASKLVANATIDNLIGSDDDTFAHGMLSDAFSVVIWAAALFSASVEWRGNRFVIGHRTRLVRE